MYEGSSHYELIFIIIEVDSGSLYTHTHTRAAGYKLYQTLSQHTHYSTINYYTSITCTHVLIMLSVLVYYIVLDISMCVIVCVCVCV